MCSSFGFRIIRKVLDKYCNITKMWYHIYRYVAYTKVLNNSERKEGYFLGFNSLGSFIYYWEVNMVTFVGAEYLIANMLIAYKRKHNLDSITFEDLNKAGIFVQKLSVKENVDAIFLSSADRLTEAIFDFSDYFSYNEENQAILIKQTKKIDDLENRFLGYLPFTVLSFLVSAVDKFVEQSMIA